jgi:hypothetical protein
MSWKMTLCLAVLMAACPLALAATPTVEDLQKTIQEMSEMMKAQQARIGQLEDKVGKDLHAEMAKAAREIAADASNKSSGPTWLENLKFMAEVRMRYENECFSGGEEGQSRDEKAVNRGRFSVKFGFSKTWLDDQMEGVFRLATGSSSDPRSTNQTFTDNFSKKLVWIDLAYIKYVPKGVPGLTALVGKMYNPYVRTNLVWDADTNPEGIWAKYEKKFGDFTPFVSAGYFSTSQNFKSYNDPNGTDYGLHNATMVGYQAGFDWTICENTKWTSAVAYYDYDGFNRSYSIAGGNHEVGTLLDKRLAATEFQVVNVTNILAFRAFDLPWSAFFDWAYNCGDEDSVAGYENQNNGLAAGLTVGQNKKKGDWSFAYEYVYLEANAVPGNFADADFETNSKGHILSARYSMTEWMTLGASLFVLERITGTIEDQRNIRTRVECTWKF